MIEGLSKEMWELIMNVLPFELTLIDDNDKVLYFNREGKRIFPRPQSIIGKKVQDCHPPKTLHLVNQVIDDLRTGRRESASFWIDLHRRKIYIRYFALRGEDDSYLGCIEVTQDITEIQKLEGERRLL
ncbi:MAG: PAS domain-containing protein [bacterium]